MLDEVKEYENKLRMGNITLDVMSQKYKEILIKLNQLKVTQGLITTLNVKDNELMNHKTEIIKNTKNEANKLNLQLQSGKITSEKFVQEYDKLLNNIKNVGKADLLILQLERDKTKEIEKQNKLKEDAAKKAKEEQTNLQNKKNEATTILYNTLGAFGATAGYAFVNEVNSLKDLEKQVFDLAVIANKSTGDIENLRNSLIELSLSAPFTAAEFGKAINDVARTGKGLEEAISIVKQSAQLAMGSGENLSDTVNIINKAITAFKIKGEDLTTVMDKLHSIVAETPLSLESLGDALKNAAGAKIYGTYNSNIILKKHLTYRYRVSTLKVG